LSSFSSPSLPLPQERLSHELGGLFNEEKLTTQHLWAFHHNPIKVVTKRGYNLCLIGGSVYSWEDEGNSARPELVLLSEPAADIAAGEGYSIALGVSGQVYSWSCNNYFSSGNDHPLGRAGEPTTPAIVKLPEYITFIVAGNGDCGYVLALGVSGQVYSWQGTWNVSERYVAPLGRNGNPYRPGRVLLPILADDPIISLAAGSFHCLALTRSGNFFSWGDNFYGQLGHPASRGFIKRFFLDGRDRKLEYLPPQLVQLPEPISVLAAGEDHTLALSKKNKVYLLGSDEHFGQNWKKNLPYQIVDLVSGVWGSRLGYLASLALTSGGQVYSFGSKDQHYSVNSVSALPKLSPGLIPFPEPIVSIATSGKGGLAVGESGQIYQWNEYSKHCRISEFIRMCRNCQSSNIVFLSSPIHCDLAPK
jgi:alpha-tubulin suppressor-like RCC1 family protein